MTSIATLYDETIEYLLGPVSDLLADEAVSEIMINGFDEVFIEKEGKLYKTEHRFADQDALDAAARGIAQFVGKRLSPEEPSVEARLPDGSRVHIVQPPAARKGLCIAIRKFGKHKLDLNALIGFGALTEEAAEFLSICVAMAKNLIVSGGTGSGKTTLLNCLSAMILPGERIIVIEDSSELQLQQEHVVPFESQAPDRNGRGGVSIRELFRASLRMRPDRIVVGECRGQEALDMIQAMTSGHSGSLSTCHANSPMDALSRLETMSLMGELKMPLAALRKQLASAIDVIVQISRFHDGSRKITHVSEVLPLSADGEYVVQDLYQLKNVDGKQLSQSSLIWTGNTPSFAAQPVHAGLTGMIEKSASCWIQSEN